MSWREPALSRRRLGLLRDVRGDSREMRAMLPNENKLAPSNAHGGSMVPEALYGRTTRWEATTHIAVYNCSQVPQLARCIVPEPLQG
jgi:hypothetical protein